MLRFLGLRLCGLEGCLGLIGMFRANPKTETSPATVVLIEANAAADVVARIPILREVCDFVEPVSSRGKGVYFTGRVWGCQFFVGFSGRPHNPNPNHSGELDPAPSCLKRVGFYIVSLSSCHGTETKLLQNGLHSN